MAVVILQGPHFGIVGGRESRHWHSEFNDCCSPDCAFCCEIYCCSPCKFGRIAEALPPGSALCAGNCCGAGVLYGALGSVVYSAAVVGAFFFGLGCALSGATGVCRTYSHWCVPFFTKSNPPDERDLALSDDNWPTRSFAQLHRVHDRLLSRPYETGIQTAFWDRG